jgi:hypothetical protein
MSVKNSIVSAAVAVSIAAGSLGPMSSVAFADTWGGRNAYRQGDRDWNVHPDRRYRGFEQYRYGRPDWRHWNDRDERAERREDRRDRRLVRGVAIGLGVLMLGAILSQANADQHRYDERYDD